MTPLFYRPIILAIVVSFYQFTTPLFPFDRSNPVIYDNDNALDVYTDELVMALASAGEIDLRGMISTTSIAPYNHLCDFNCSETIVRLARITGVTKARRSGFRNAPDPVLGCIGHLVKPDSGEIADTKPCGSWGAWLIVDEARKASVTKPLVVVVGGPLSTVADAYLLDNRIAENVVVSYMGGDRDQQRLTMLDFNSWADGWAAHIVIQKFRVMMFTDLDSPMVPHGRLPELPDTELRQWMIDKPLALYSIDREIDGDALPVVPLMRPDSIESIRRVSFAGSVDLATHGNVHVVPVLKDDPFGASLMVRINARAATDSWWRAMTNPVAWKGRVAVPRQRLGSSGHF